MIVVEENILDVLRMCVFEKRGKKVKQSLECATSLNRVYQILQPLHKSNIKTE